MKRTKQSTFAKRERQEKATGFAPVGSEDMSKSEGAQFTPGPWYAANMGNDFQGLVVEEQTGKNIAVAYDKRDVHILAAAPVMYGALLQVREMLLILADNAGDVPEWNTGGEMCELAHIVRTALAQAEGRQG